MHRPVLKSEFLQRNRQPYGGECRLISPTDEYTGKQGLDYLVGISAETVGSRALHLQLVTIPPGGRAKAHKHATHETAIYALQGT